MKFRGVTSLRFSPVPPSLYIYSFVAGQNKLCTYVYNFGLGQKKSTCTTAPPCLVLLQIHSILIYEIFFFFY